MNSFVFIDGPDGVGKTSTTKYINDVIIPNERFTRGSILQLPSRDGPLAFIRDLVKDNSFKVDDFSRQLIHCSNNIYTFMATAYSDYTSKSRRKTHQYFICDRGPISGMVYGSALIKDKNQLDIVNRINFSVLESLVDNDIISEIVFVLIDRENPYRSADSSYYEQETNFKDIRQRYFDTFYKLHQENNHNRIRYVYFDVKPLMDVKEVSNRVWGLIKG